MLSEAKLGLITLSALLSTVHNSPKEAKLVDDGLEEIERLEKEIQNLKTDIKTQKRLAVYNALTELLINIQNGQYKTKYHFGDSIDITRRSGGSGFVYTQKQSEIADVLDYIHALINFNKAEK